MKKIILISGCQGSGKTTLAKGLIKKIQDELKIGPIHRKFADPMYEMHEAMREVADKYGIPFDKKEGRLLQLIGTNWGRECKGENVWVDALKNIIGDEKGITIIDDCRFKNELSSFSDAFKIRLLSPAEVRKERADAWREDVNHPSEIDLDGMEDKFDLVIDTSVHTKEFTLNLVMQKWLNSEDTK